MELSGAPPDGESDGVWEVPPCRSPDPAAAPVLSADGFEGPLDWLLELGRTRQIDLRKISIAALVELFEAASLRALARPGTSASTLGRLAGDCVAFAF